MVECQPFSSGLGSDIEYEYIYAFVDSVKICNFTLKPKRLVICEIYNK